MDKPTEAELIATLREATEVLEILRRGHGVDVSGKCYPALNNCRDILQRVDNVDPALRLTKGPQ